MMDTMDALQGNRSQSLQARLPRWTPSSTSVARISLNAATRVGIRSLPGGHVNLRYGFRVIDGRELDLYVTHHLVTRPLVPLLF